MERTVTLPAHDEVRIRERIPKVPIFGTLGFRDFVVGADSCSCVVPWKREYDGIFETFHGGIMLAAADSLAAIAVLTVTGPGARIATTDMSIRFLAPVRSELRVEARVVRAGRTLIPVDVALRDGDGTLAATAQVTYMRLDGDDRTISGAQASDARGNRP